MTQIDFHVNAPDKLSYACRVVRKAYASGARAVVYVGDEAACDVIDRMLWTFSPTDFIPHCRLASPLARVTPIHIASAQDVHACVHHGLLVNLDRAQPDVFSRFERMIEIVASAEDELEAGRQRWKFYRDRGYPLTRHDLSSRPVGGSSNNA